MSTVDHAMNMRAIFALISMWTADHAMNIRAIFAVMKTIEHHAVVNLKD